jgi:hypothetical protein
LAIGLAFGLVLSSLSIASQVQQYASAYTRQGNCTLDPNHNWFVGQGLYDSTNDVGAAKVTVDTQQPYAMCSDPNNGILAWSMVAGPIGTNGYAQAGWIQLGPGGAYSNPHLFTESHWRFTSKQNFSRQYFNQLSYGTTHTYETVTHVVSGGQCKLNNLNQADYYFDNGSLPFSSDCIDWDAGASAQYYFETQLSWNYTPFLSFTSPQYCRRGAGSLCRASTSFSFTSTNNTNWPAPNGCYREVSSTYFEAYDQQLYPNCTAP